MSPQVAAWPQLPRILSSLLDGIEREEEEFPRHPRPWDLATVPEYLADLVWPWLADVVDWLNDQYAWQPEAIIPRCWPDHPPLALELAVLAFARETAARSTLPRDLQSWHDDLYAFHRRMRESAGEVGLGECRRGVHAERPSQYDLELHHATT